ncbi:MAG: TIM barrel protein [Verrucomicrobia bacterium]|nr:TIM barrel protein [Verrucomicrobiota bacterium]
MLSISTCWNSSRHTDGAAMLEELLEFGFEQIELGHGIRMSLMHGIQSHFDKGRVQFSSLHNFCPLPVEILNPSPDCLLFSSHREEERERAVRQTLQTIDFAERLGAPNVVLHSGRVVMEPVTAQLIEMANAGLHLSPEYARLKTRAVMEREKIAPKHLARLKDCLKRIVEHAAAKNIRLGLESRQAYEEIPSEREFDALLAEYPAPTVGYWHDFGHVQIRQNLGFVNHAEWLTHSAPRLIGCHLHDVIWPGRDHLAPFTGGSVQYDQLVPLLPKGMLYVWEMSPRRSREEIAESLRLWKEKFGYE